MRPRSTPSPKGSVYSQNDVATYRDLLLFEERLKTTAASLQRRKSRYQLFLLQLLLVIVFLLAEVLLPAHISLLAIPYKLVLQRVLPDIYTEDTEVYVHPYFSTGLLFVSVTTWHCSSQAAPIQIKLHTRTNMSRTLTARCDPSTCISMSANHPCVQKSTLTRSPSSSAPYRGAPSPSATSSSSRSSSGTRTASQPAIGSTSTSVPIPPIPPTTNPRGELRFSSRVDRSFREGYERYRANFERKRAQQMELVRGQGWFGRVTALVWGWRHRDAPAPVLLGSLGPVRGERRGMADGAGRHLYRCARGRRRGVGRRSGNGMGRRCDQRLRSGGARPPCAVAWMESRVKGFGRRRGSCTDRYCPGPESRVREVKFE
ncbi:hypothetical protein B0H10DRAFT_717105 [Mycena sp. CBHHK59/15]|nr:hypothetical protein B0H10DRAFT_717105 [Mycena sp. CBHHK59/15]